MNGSPMVGPLCSLLLGKDEVGVIVREGDIGKPGENEGESRGHVTEFNCLLISFSKCFLSR